MCADVLLPFVSIVMPCFNEERYIEEVLAAVQNQDYPRDRIEILVTDGMSHDATREIISKIAASDPRVILIDNPDRIQAPGMNAAIRRAKGDVIIRMDVHADYAPDFVRKCVEVLEETGAQNVGGAARTKSKSFFQRALCAALDSALAVGGSKYRDPDNEGWVESVFPGAFRREVFETAGLFDPGAITNEDAEINQRIHQLGGGVYLSKKIHVFYYPRDSVSGLAKQYFKYGQGRARTLLKHGKFLSLRPAIPFLMVVGGVTLIVVPALHPILPWAAGAYAVLTGIEAIRVGAKAGIEAIPVVWAVFPIVHISHGLGFGAGLLKYLRSPDWTQPERLPARGDELLGRSP